MIDIFPTLVDYAKLKGNHKKNDRAADLGGHSLRVFLDNPDSQQWGGPQGALTMIGNYGQVTGIEAVDKQSYSFRTKDWRYILYSAGQEELYDHQNDPNEWNNLVFSENKSSDLLKNLRLQIAKMLAPIELNGLKEIK